MKGAKDVKPDPRLRRRAVMRPRFTLTILYLFGFFFVFAVLLGAPTLVEAWTEYVSSPPTTPEEERLAREALGETMRQVMRPRLWIAALLAIASVALGMTRGVLPGTGAD